MAVINIRKAPHCQVAAPPSRGQGHWKKMPAGARHPILPDVRFRPKYKAGANQPKVLLIRYGDWQAESFCKPILINKQLPVFLLLFLTGIDKHKYKKYLASLRIS